MAKKKIENILPHQFQPGVSGNPGGRPRLPDDLKKARKLNQIEVSRVINRYMNMHIKEIKDDTERSDTKALEAMIGKIIMEAHKYGDYSRVNFLFDRMIGKVTEKVEHKLPKPTVVNFPDGSSMVLGSAEKDEEDEL